MGYKKLIRFNFNLEIIARHWKHRSFEVKSQRFLQIIVNTSDILDKQTNSENICFNNEFFILYFDEGPRGLIWFVSQIYAKFLYLFGSRLNFKRVYLSISRLCNSLIIAFQISFQKDSNKFQYVYRFTWETPKLKLIRDNLMISFLSFLKTNK